MSRSAQVRGVASRYYQQRSEKASHPRTVGGGRLGRGRGGSQPRGALKSDSKRKKKKKTRRLGKRYGGDFLDFFFLLPFFHKPSFLFVRKCRLLRFMVSASSCFITKTFIICQCQRRKKMDLFPSLCLFCLSPAAQRCALIWGFRDF